MTRKILSIKKLFTLLFLSIGVCFAQSYNTTILYQYNLWGQDFTLTEYSDGSKCRLLITMSDNLSKEVKTFDNNLPTTFYIWSKWFTNPGEYSTNIEESKHFLYYGMALIYLKNMKDICDLAPFCKLLEYKIKKVNNKKQIVITFDCSDLLQFFTFAGQYNAIGRDYVIEQYCK